MLPFVILIDLDGTTYGDLSDHITEWVIGQHLKKIDPKNKSIPGAFSKTFRTCLASGLLRPGFVEFMHALVGKEDKRHGLEPFVYTASSADWAPVAVSNVEAVTGVKFQRPILTRNQCGTSPITGDTTKSLTIVKPIIFRTLKKKYPALTHPNDLDNRFVLIDNSDVLIERYAWIPCSTYDYVSNFDVLKNVDLETLREDFAIILRELIRQGALSRGTSKRIKTYDDFASYYYSRLAKNFASNSAKNAKEKQDTFWKVFVAIALPIIHRLHASNNSLSTYNIASINKVIFNALQHQSGRQ